MIGCSLSLTGCSDAGRGASDAVVVRDSANVSIVVNAEPEWAAGDEWRLGEADLWVGAEATSDVLFTQITDLITLPDGVIAVANRVDPAQILLLGSDGELVGTVGRTGEGPGEFGSVERLWFIPPDTLLAFDGGRSLLHRFTLVGRYIEATRVNPYVPPGGAGATLSVVRGRFQDGTILLAPFLMLPHRNAAAARGRDSVPIARATEAGEIIDTIGVFPTIDYMRLSTGMVTTPVWQKESTILANQNSVLLGMGDTFTIEEYGLDGRLLRRILRSGVEPRSSASLKNDYIAAAEQFYGSSGPGNVRRMIEERFIGEELPAFGKDWLIDAESHLWVPEYVPIFPGVTPAGETEWSVFNPSGRWLGQVRMPSSLQPTEIGRDYVLGVWLDEFQVPSVRRFRLVR
jgi:hypothetical protein